MTKKPYRFDDVVITVGGKPIEGVKFIDFNSNAVLRPPTLANIATWAINSGKDLGVKHAIAGEASDSYVRLILVFDWDIDDYDFVSACEAIGEELDPRMPAHLKLDIWPTRLPEPPLEHYAQEGDGACWAVLGLPGFTADERAVKRAYARAARAAGGPERGGRRFAEVRQAYEAARQAIADELAVGPRGARPGVTFDNVEPWFDHDVKVAQGPGQRLDFTFKMPVLDPYYGGPVFPWPEPTDEQLRKAYDSYMVTPGAHRMSFEDFKEIFTKVWQRR